MIVASGTLPPKPPSTAAYSTVRFEVYTWPAEGGCAYGYQVGDDSGMFIIGVCASEKFRQQIIAEAIGSHLKYIANGELCVCGALKSIHGRAEYPPKCKEFVAREEF